MKEIDKYLRDKEQAEKKINKILNKLDKAYPRYNIILNTQTQKVSITLKPCRYQLCKEPWSNEN